MEEKNVSVESKKRGLPWKKTVVILYICAGISIIIAGLMTYFSLAYVLDYYGSYGMSVTSDLKSVIQYVISGSGTYIGFAVAFWAAGLILNRLDHILDQEKEDVSEKFETKEDKEPELIEGEAGEAETDLELSDTTPKAQEREEEPEEPSQEKDPNE
ncbi:hypothetical protein LI177_09065 [bacterium 210820-DFI.6.37]|nr:hypothetical protein [bacterium 210820-DFI.6.37]